MGKKIDYLTTDEEIPGQRWVCLSFLTPELIKNCNIRSIKVRGCYASEEEAKNRCEQLQRVDGLHNVYIAPVGKWLPWCDDPEKANDFEYAETELNKLMKAYRKNQEDAKVLHAQRKNEMINKSIKEVDIMEDKKKEITEKLKKVVENEDLNLEKEKEKLDNLKNNLDNEKKDLDNITDELEKAEKLYQEMLERQNKQNI